MMLWLIAATLKQEVTVTVIEIKAGFWKLVSEGEDSTLVFYGYSRAEVEGRFNSWLRRKDLEKLR